MRDKFYVGAGDLKEPGVWLNIDGTPFNNKLWPSERDSSSFEMDENCVETAFVGKEIFDLNPRSCKGPASGVLCEKPVSGARICPPYYVLFFGEWLIVDLSCFGHLTLKHFDDTSQPIISKLNQMANVICQNYWHHMIGCMICVMSIGSD